VKRLKLVQVPGAGHLHQLQPLRGRRHLAGEGEGHQHVDVGQARDDVGFVADNDVARRGETRPHRGLERGREGSGEGDAQHVRSPVRHPPPERPEDQLPRR